MHTLTYTPPPKLMVNRSLFHVCDHTINPNCSPDDCGFGEADDPTDVCHIVLSSPGSNQVPINWSATLQGTGGAYDYLPGPSHGHWFPANE